MRLPKLNMVGFESSIVIIEDKNGDKQKELTVDYVMPSMQLKIINGTKYKMKIKMQFEYVEVKENK